MTFHVPEKYRLKHGPMGSDESYRNNGVFIVPFKRKVGSSINLNIIASQDMGWEHVSVSTPSKIPTWEMMCFIKNMFWDETDCVMQLHPPKSDYINNHPNCLHLWRPIEQEIPTPPSIMVGIK